MPVSKNNISEAVKVVKQDAGKRKFLQGVDLVVGLKNLDLTKPENRVSAEVPLPHGTGKEQKIAIFAEGELARTAEEAGIDRVIGRKEVEELGKDRSKAKRMADEYSSFLAPGDMMVHIGKHLGPVLGPRGKMPKPLSPDVTSKELGGKSGSTVRINVRQQLTVSLQVGKEDMPEDQIADNVEAVLNSLESNLPKGLRQVKSICVKATMGKPARVEVK